MWKSSVSFLRRSWVVGALAMGCAAAPAGPLSPPTVDVTGTWLGRWWLIGVAGGGSVELALTQAGGHVSGTMRTSGLQLSRPEGPLYGAVAGNVLTLRGPLVCELTVKGDEMSGTFESYIANGMMLRRAQ